MKMNKKGLTLTCVIEAESPNYGEGVGNVTSLKKITRNGRESYTYISRQALRYNITEQMGCNNTKLGLDGDVIQFHQDTTIKEYPEIDLFGYMKTVKPIKTRAAVVRLSNAISLETFNSDLDFLTNKGLLDRYNETATKKKDGGNIAQGEIHKSYYAYTLTIDLDKVGIDSNDDIEITSVEKAKRINDLLKTIKFLYRDIKGRRENLSPIFLIGGVYDIKNPFFENRVKCKNNRINIEILKDIINQDEEIKNNTKVGVLESMFANNNEIKKELGATSIGDVFESLGIEVDKYFNGK